MSIAQIAALALASGLAAVLSSCGGTTTTTTSPPSNPNTTVVTPLPGEDLATGCTYDLLMQHPAQIQAGVLVIFDRVDTSVIYSDATVQAMASSIGYAMIFAHECDAGSYNDLQADASKGPGRALFAALNQFATQTKHPELATSGVILYGFSASAVLSATMTNYAPSRVRGAIAYAPGSNETNLLQITPASGALKVPTLILTNAQDPVAGTTHGYSYFLEGRAAGAPWGFGVQNQSGHCCNSTTRSMVVTWVPAVAAYANKASAGTLLRFVCSPDGVIDASNETNCKLTTAAVSATGSSGEQSAWMPDSTSAAAWLAWVTNPGVNQ